MDYLLGSRTFHLSTSRNPFSAPRAMVTASSRRPSLASPPPPPGLCAKAFPSIYETHFPGFFLWPNSISGPQLSQEAPQASLRLSRAGLGVLLVAGKRQCISMEHTLFPESKSFHGSIKTPRSNFKKSSDTPKNSLL